MTTLRGSRAMVWPTVSVRLHRVHGRTSVWLRGHPVVPVSLKIWAWLTFCLVEPLRVVDPGFGIRPGAGDGGCELRPADRGEACAVEEIGDVQYASHHQERGESRASAEPA